jgi:transposase
VSSPTKNEQRSNGSPDPENRQRAVERARIIWYSSRGDLVEAIAERVGIRAHTVRRWITRINESGLPALEDSPRSGKPQTYSPERRSPKSSPSR